MAHKPVTFGEMATNTLVLRVLKYTETKFDNDSYSRLKKKKKFMFIFKWQIPPLFELFKQINITS